MKKKTKQNILLYGGIATALTGLYFIGKGEKLTDIFTNLFTKKSTEIDYNNPNIHAPIDFYLDNTTGIATASDGSISVGVWSAVKEGIKSIFR